MIGTFRLIDAHGAESAVVDPSDALVEEIKRRGVIMLGPICITCGHDLDDRSGHSCHTVEAIYAPLWASLSNGRIQ